MRRRSLLIPILSCLMLLALVATATGQPPTSLPAEPQTVSEVAELGKQAVSAARGGSWWYFSALVIMAVMFGAKRSGLLAKLGRWRYVVVPVLSLAAALLAAFQGGVSIEAAGGVFSTGWATGMVEELWSHGILGKPHSSGA